MSPVTVGIIGAGNVIWAYLQVLDRLVPRGLARMGPVCARRKENRGRPFKRAARASTWWRTQLRSCDRMWTWCSSLLRPKVIHCWYGTALEHGKQVVVEKPAATTRLRSSATF